MKKFCEKIELKKLVIESRGPHDYKQEDEYKNSVKKHLVKFNGDNQEEELEGNMIDMMEEVKTLFLERSDVKFINELAFAKIEKSEISI